MELIETMPNYLGQQVYNFGAPLQADEVKVDGVTVQQIFLRKGNGKYPFKEDEEFAGNICCTISLLRVSR